MGFINKIFGTHSQHELKRIKPIVDKILGMREQWVALSDEELQHKTVEFKERLAKGETLDDILPEAFATVREASRRVLGEEHYPVQLTGGIVLHQGRIAEMRTGEGKTNVAALPSYLNALAGEGVHVVTVNDYLAQRDAENEGKVHRFLGLTVGCVLNSMNNDERRAAYNCDITYVTNNELGFDYLRDNMVVYKEQLVMRGLHFAIIDEVDSILIDEARTPLIISGQSGKSTKLYEVCDILAKRLEKGEASAEFSKMNALMGEEITETGDFVVSEKDKTINLTERGVQKVEQFFHIDNLADAENLEIQHNMIMALKANYMMFRDQDYVVKDDEILIVDEFTGRIMPGRRYSDGLHQAIEAKEHVKVKRESKTLATITFQNFFNKFDKKCGMTGTALTEEREFRNIYGMDVVEIPTNKPIARIDHQDAVYKTKKEKYKAVCDEVEETYKKGQPVLVGTVNIDTSELLSGMLKRRGIPHNVLNAKYHELEAQIVAGAGVHGSVTIATNMAGRGTDIKLDEESRKLGGLKIIGTERHESRRIDNQLRGRSGRQGDPGESRFYISLEDDLMRLFGSEKIMSMFNALGVQDGEQIEHKMLTSAIEKAQKKIEGNNYGIRENVLKYDEVMNEQREIIYKERRQVLDGESMKDVILKMIRDIVSQVVDRTISDEQAPEDWDFTQLNIELRSIIPLTEYMPSADETKNMKKAALKETLTEMALQAYADKESEFPDPESMREAERVVLLKTIDRKWMDHIDDMDQLRQGIGLQAYAQRDPLNEYKMAGYDMFNE
ncbi:MAG: preprotein translocase subunit SecA, partial [Clostridiales bacterium]|nr:preprotein translocase subunit SecA [Clostridiales bacterium]